MISPKRALTLSAILLLVCHLSVMSQDCTTLGQTPSTAFPVCGTSTFTQNSVPLCQTNDIFVPGCIDGAAYANKNPFFYKFHCYTSGTLGFIITPLAANEDYDWQLWDITGKNPDDIFTDHSLVVTGNWAGTYGLTGASASGANFLQCSSSPTANPPAPTFAKMPDIIAGHDYLLMVSHFTDGQSGYTLDFSGGTAVITDPKEPHLAEVKPDCDGKTLRLKLNKKMRCNSLTASGSEFSVAAITTVVSATAATCTSGFDFDEVVITLANPLPNGNYQLVINNGTDGNSLLDNCGRAIPAGEQLSFFYAVPQPIFADSIGKVGCAPDQVKIYFPKRIACNSIAADGSDFSVTGGSSPVTVISAAGDCTNGLSDYIILKFASPVYTKGTYTVTLRAGTDGSTIIDECNIPMPVQTISFTAGDTVSAAFNYATQFGCQQNTVLFSHDGAHDVNSWNWTFNHAITANTQTHSITFPSSSTNNVQLIVSNGVCSDTSAAVTVAMDNEVKADFEMPDVICPEDGLEIINTSSGQVDTWNWSFDIAGTSTVKDPSPIHFPQTNIETYYTIKLVCSNNTLGCSDSLKKKVRVLNNCFIAVPTAFTPNNDGLNDFLYPNNALKADNLKFSVYNRWGQLVFTSNDWQKKWNGKVNGIEQASGVYVWFLRYIHRDTGQNVFQKGTTTLIR